MTRLRTVAAAALLAAGLSTPAVAAVRGGQKAPEIALPTVKGPRITLASLRGKVVILDFWAQWCEPCKKELPELEKLQREYASKGVVVVGVNLDKQRDNAERLMKQLGISFDVALDPAGGVAATYDLPKMPTSFVIDKKGIVRFVHEGFEGAGDVARFRTELDQLLKQ